MNINITELAIAGGFGLISLVGFIGSQSQQPYDLSQIRFCPVSINGEEGQKNLDKRFCNQPRYVLKRDWEKYGSYDSVLPYKGDSIQWVRDLPTDNPKQILMGGIVCVGLWGVAATLLMRSHRLERTDYEISEREKTYNYQYWTDRYSDREIYAHNKELFRDRVKDGNKALDLEERAILGLRNPEGEAFEAKMNLEDYLKTRATKHSVQDKAMAENYLAVAKANAEREMLEKNGIESGGSAKDSPPDSKQLDPSESDAWDVLKAIATADNSTALIASPGSGKSVTLDNLIKIILEDNDNADITVISAKNDSFYGLADEGRVHVYELANPEPVIEVFENFYSEYLKRKEIRNEEERQKLSPLVLILDDWMIVSDQLEAIAKEYPDFNMSAILLEILLIGREYNCKFFASLQSFNLEALGIKKLDSQSRSCLNLLLLGNKYKKSGRSLESYGGLEQVLNHQAIIPDSNTRDRLKKEYQRIKAISQKHLRPAMVASFGDYVVALMPYLTKPKRDRSDESGGKVDPYSQITDWAKDKNISDSAIAEKWEELTGRKPNGTEIEIIKEHIEATRL